MAGSVSGRAGRDRRPIRRDAVVPSVEGVHRLLQAIGLLFVAIGVGGLVDLLGLLPPPGPVAVLTAVNGYVVPHLPMLVGFELFTNLTIAIGGIVVVVAAESLAER